MGPPAPEEDDWATFDVLKPNRIILTNRDHVRDAEVLLLCDGLPMLHGGRSNFETFVEAF